jgi:hypothetical protein
MTRAELQFCYELAFYPPRLNEVWHQLKRGEAKELDALGQSLDTALLLHQALPESGYASQRALARLAEYQAHARAFGLPRFLRNVRRHLQRAPLSATVVPPALVRDIVLPRLGHG